MIGYLSTVCVLSDSLLLKYGNNRFNSHYNPIMLNIGQFADSLSYIYALSVISIYFVTLI